MLPCQRDRFDIPADIAWLNAAAWGPLPLAAVEAGRIGVARKAQPWRLPADVAEAQYARARAAAATLIGAAPADVAIIPSVGYGVSTAAKALDLPPGSRVLVLADDHSAPVLEWLSRARSHGILLDTVARPEDGDWTAAVLHAIARHPPALASIASVHWSDGGALDLSRIAPALRAAGAALLVDATHAVGAGPVDVAALDPDFLVFPTYKWTLGPYGRAFLYVAPRRQDGVPLEQTAHGRRGVSAERIPYLADTRYLPDARRFDMGERDHFVSLEMAAIGMELLAALGPAAVAERLAALTAALAQGLGALGLGVPGLGVPGTAIRAPQILSVTIPGGTPAGFLARLAEAGVYVADRLGRIRISPHIYNDAEDVARCVAAFRTALAAGGGRS
ncbi:MAG: aminotransferase class V-fold PLP-dependent enzyme [Acetobacteraceae bacterium]